VVERIRLCGVFGDTPQCRISVPLIARRRPVPEDLTFPRADPFAGQTICRRRESYLISNTKVTLVTCLAVPTTLVVDALVRLKNPRS
jgi:hypothetical protein